MQPNQEVEEIISLRKLYGEIKEELSKVIVGQEEAIEKLFICLLSQGHGLLMGVPGLAKTLLVNSLAQTSSLSFGRIQFTPDLMPSDVTGSEILQSTKDKDGREFVFVKGPIFANVILADEINRTPPKTQSALLEAMQENHVTVMGKLNHKKLPQGHGLLGGSSLVGVLVNSLEQEASSLPFGKKPVYSL